MSQKKTSRLYKKKHYLQVAFNSTLEEARQIISILPPSDRIIIEVGTPLIKEYGALGIRSIRSWWEARLAGNLNERGEQIFPYIVADMKTIDRGATEVAIAAHAGASAVIAMGSAPTETLNAFIASCEALNIDPMIDMMNVEFPINVLRGLKHQPKVVILHRGVDEERDNRGKMLPLHEIRRTKGAYDTLIAVAGGDTPREVQSAAFNDADIVVIWKSVYKRTDQTLDIINTFLKEIK